MIYDLPLPFHSSFFLLIGSFLQEVHKTPDNFSIHQCYQIMNLNKNITVSDGYIGINGPFRLFNDGSNQHSLDIVEIRPSGNVIIDNAENRFTEEKESMTLPAINATEIEKAPKIFGKDEQSAQIAIFGALIAPKDQETPEETNLLAE